MDRVIAFIFIVLAAVTAQSAQASINDYVVKQWNLQNGLPSQSIKSIAQDHHGYIWLATQFGLSRFDGTKFTNFTTQNTHFLRSNAIHKILVGRDGKLWVGTRRGLHRLDPQTLDVESLDIAGPVRDILEDEHGSIWVAASGLHYVSHTNLNLSSTPETSQPRKLTAVKVNQIVGAVSKMALAADGIWLVNERHLLKIKQASSSTAHSFRLELSSRLSLPQQLAQTILHDLAWIDGRLFLATELGAYFLDIDEVLRRYNDIGNAAVYKFLSDGEGGIWVSTSSSLMYKEVGGSWQSVRPVQSEQGVWFSDIFKDRENNIWLASLNEGLWFAHAGKVERFSVGRDANQGITALAKSPSGQIWVANRYGLGTLDSANQYQSVIDMKTLQRSAINDLEFQDGALLMGTDRGVLVYKDGTLQTLPHRELRQNPVFSISPSNKGGLWFGTGRGLYRLEYSELTPFNYNAFLGSQFVTFVVDFPEFGFIGTNKGAYRYNNRGIEKLGGRTSLETAYITSILHIQGVATLVGSWSDGLFYRTPDGNWYQLDASNGVPYGSIASLHFDKLLKQVWVSTKKGVYRMPVQQFSGPISNLKVDQVISQFDRQLDGKASRCCSGFGHDAVMETEQSIWYPSSQGVVKIPKDLQLFGSDELALKIEAMFTPKRRIAVEKIGNNVHLETSERDLTLQFTVIDFYAPQSIEFRYRLLTNGKDESADWRETQHRQDAIYTNLSPGEYVFELQAKRRGQDWTDATQKNVTVFIPRRFDETMYFRLLITCGFVFLFYLIFWVIRAQERRKQQALEDLVAERTTELRKANDKLNQVNTQLKLVSHTDELTGLRSRRFLFDQLPKDVEHYQRNAQSLQQQNKSLVLIILNIDKFSKINDAYGPIGGDSCLQQMAALLNARTQGSDYVARWSGDEFLLLLRDFKRDEVEQYVSELCKAVANFDFNLPNGKPMTMSVSMG